MSGDCLEGYIKSFDNFSILLDAEGDILVYKHAVVTLTSTDGQFRLHQ
jgi:host factor-I protein